MLKVRRFLLDSFSTNTRLHTYRPRFDRLDPTDAPLRTGRYPFLDFGLWFVLQDGGFDWTGDDCQFVEGEDIRSGF
jgi:hypothetical protein